jgi:hypothetical protein
VGRGAVCLGIGGHGRILAPNRLRVEAVGP